tara:strand:- start:666 stop:1031 length:366 start_codon:yes stop_codon:yes gene_type:complete
MKFKYFLTTLLVGLLSSQVSSVPINLGQIKKMDTDEDGSITLEEFNTNTLSRFSLMDDNGDGMLSEKEFLTPSSSRFERMDLNSDGILKRKEIKKALKKLRKRGDNSLQGKKKQPKPFIKQ